VDTIFVEYGVNLTPQLSSNRRKMKRNDNVQDKEEHPRYKDRRANRHRHLQTDEDYLYQFSGDIVGVFSDSIYTAPWDGNFFAIGDKDIYVFDYGEGSKEFPVMYFPQSKPVTASNVQGMNSFADAVAAGGEHGFVTFNIENKVNGVITDGLTLYTISGSDGESYSEVIRSRGGQIVPVNFVEGEIEGEILDFFIGGKDGDNILAWTTGNLLEINTISGNNYLSSKGVDSLTLDGIAFDDSTGKQTEVLFEFIGNGTIIDQSRESFTDGPSNSGVQELFSTVGVGFVMLLLTSLLC